MERKSMKEKKKLSGSNMDPMFHPSLKPREVNALAIKSFQLIDDVADLSWISVNNVFYA